MCDGAAGYLRRSDCDEMCKEGDEGVVKWGYRDALASWKDGRNKL